VKYQQLSLVACIICFVCVVYSLFIYYMKINTNIAIKVVDLQTVTAGDYTIEVEITDNMIEKFKEEKKDEIQKAEVTEALILKEYLMEKFK
jgi:hypothetical protein